MFKARFTGMIGELEASFFAEACAARFGEAMRLLAKGGPLQHLALQALWMDEASRRISSGGVLDWGGEGDDPTSPEGFRFLFGAAKASARLWCGPLSTGLELEPPSDPEELGPALDAALAPFEWPSTARLRRAAQDGRAIPLTVGLFSVTVETVQP